MCLSFKILNLFRILSAWGSSNYRPYAPFLDEVATHVKNCHFGDYYLVFFFPTGKNDKMVHDVVIHNYFMVILFVKQIYK